MHAIKRASIALLAGTAIVLGSSQAANAWGSGSWYVQPTNCNAGSFYGTSWYDFPNGLAKSQTSESGNFCWFGNVKVTSAVRDNWGNGYGWSSAANFTQTYFPTSYGGSWGGIHAWRDSGGRLT